MQKINIFNFNLVTIRKYKQKQLFKDELFEALFYFSYFYCMFLFVLANQEASQTFYLLQLCATAHLYLNIALDNSSATGSPSSLSVCKQAQAFYG